MTWKGGAREVNKSRGHSELLTHSITGADGITCEALQIHVPQGELSLAAKPAETGQRRGKKGSLGWSGILVHQEGPMLCPRERKGRGRSTQKLPKDWQFPVSHHEMGWEGAADEVVWLQQLKAKLCHMAQD